MNDEHVFVDVVENIGPTNNRYADFRKDEKEERISAALSPAGSMVRDIVAKTGLNALTCRYHLTLMELAGLVRSEKIRNFVYYYPIEGQP